MTNSKLFLVSNIYFMIALLLLIFSVSSCGSYEIPKSEVVESEGQCGDKRVCTARNDEGSGFHKGQSTPVETAADSDHAEKSYIYISKKKSQQKHIEEAPKGYRLLTRGEAITALEAGELDEYLNQTDSFWTSTDANHTSEMAWVISVENEYELMKTVALPALFVAE